MSLNSEIFDDIKTYLPEMVVRYGTPLTAPEFGDVVGLFYTGSNYFCPHVKTEEYLHKVDNYKWVSKSYFKVDKHFL